MTSKKRTTLIALSSLIVLCLTIPIASTVLRPAPPTEAQLVGTWIAGEASVTLTENGTASLQQVPAAEGVITGAASWRLSEDSSEGWIVTLNHGDLTLRLTVDQQFNRTSLVRHTCDPDAQGCSIAFELASSPQQAGLTS